MIFWSTSVNVGRVRGERAGGGRRGGQEGGGYLGTIRMLPVALCELRMFLL